MDKISAFGSLREALYDILEPTGVVDDPVVLQEYARDCSFVTGTRPLLAVYPRNKAEVKGVVTLAHALGMPLTPVSSGAPHFNGDTLPGQSGIVMDFRRMNRILKIDEVNRCVMVEPGVTFGQLLPELQKSSLRLNIPFRPRASKSVLTSCLEREPPVMPKYQYDHVDPLLTLEVIYGSGGEFRTGSASGPGDMDHLRSDKVNPWGPGSVDYHRFVSGGQGTMGIVTWAMIKAEVRPSIRRLYFIACPDSGRSAALMGDLLRKRVVDECLCLDQVNLAAMLAESNAEYDRLKAELPAYTTIVGIAGYRRRPEERVAIQETYLQDICNGHGLAIDTALAGAGRKEQDMLEWTAGASIDGLYWKNDFKGTCHSIFFLSPLSAVAKFQQVVRDATAGHAAYADGIGCYFQPLVQGRACHCEFTLFCDESNAEQTAIAEQLCQELSETLMRNGAYFSRPYPAWAAGVYSRNPEGVAALRKLKDIFDPHHIFNPGKLCF